MNLKIQQNEINKLQLRQFLEAVRRASFFERGRNQFKNRSGCIIGISSVVAMTGNPGQANYAAAKAGIMGFTKSLAREVASRSITVNAVAPGFIQTDMTESLSHEQKETLTSQIPMARLGKVEEIAQTVLFLAGDGGSYITAQTLHVSGGMYTV